MIKNKDVRIEKIEGDIVVTDGKVEFFKGKDCENNRSLAVEVYLVEKYDKGRSDNNGKSNR